METDELEKELCKLIAYAGDSKSAAIEAMEACRAGDLALAAEHLAKSDESLLISHNVQSGLIVSESRGEDVQLSMLMMHAVSTFTAAETSNIFAKQFVEFYKEMRDKS